MARSVIARPTDRDACERNNKTLTETATVAKEAIAECSRATVLLLAYVVRTKVFVIDVFVGSKKFHC